MSCAAPAAATVTPKTLPRTAGWAASAAGLVWAAAGGERRAGDGDECQRWPQLRVEHRVGDRHSQEHRADDRGCSQRPRQPVHHNVPTHDQRTDHSVASLAGEEQSEGRAASEDLCYVRGSRRAETHPSPKPVSTMNTSSRPSKGRLDLPPARGPAFAQPKPGGAEAPGRGAARLRWSTCARPDVDPAGQQGRHGEARRVGHGDGCRPAAAYSRPPAAGPIRRAGLLFAALRLLAAGRLAVGTWAGTSTTSAGATSCATTAWTKATITTTHRGPTSAKQNPSVTAARTRFAPISSRRLSRRAPRHRTQRDPGQH